MKENHLYPYFQKQNTQNDTRTNMLLRSIFFVFLVSSFASCGPDYLFDEDKKIADGQWQYRDTLDFRFTVTDTAQLYNMFADFEYADTFSTQNIYLKLHTRFPDGRRISKVRSFDLFDAQGTAIGKCSGHACKTRILLQDKAYFNLPGEYMITLEQYTRLDPLPGMNVVGLAVEKTGTKRK